MKKVRSRAGLRTADRNELAVVASADRRNQVIFWSDLDSAIIAAQPISVQGITRTLPIRDTITCRRAFP
jgi:hypothetical protein